MGFSELGLIAEDVGLSYDSERMLLYGDIHGYGAIISDTGSAYEIRLFCAKPFSRESAVTEAVNALSESLPKNTVEKQSCEYGYILILLNKYMLLQENIVYLIGFLEKLTESAKRIGLPPEAYKLPKTVKPAAKATDNSGNSEKISLRFDIRSVFGLLGAVIGALAVTVISILVIDVKTEADMFGLTVEISSYIVAAAATALIFFDYVFLSKKLDAFGVICCPLLSLAAVYLSAFGAGVRAVCAAENVTPVIALASFAGYLEKNAYIDSFMMGYLTRGMLLAALASVVICIWYFKKHPNETTDSEKLISRDEKTRK